MKAKKAIFPWLILAASLSIYLVFYYMHIENLLDSDMSSELILGKLLSCERRLLTSRWYYSTELRLLDTNIVYALLFTFCDSFHEVRFLAAPIMLLIYAGGFYYMCRALRLREYYPYLMSLLMLPFTADYLYLYLLGFYYIFHATILFVAIGLIADLYNGASGRGASLRLLLLCMLSFVAGATGLRLIMTFYVPLIGVVFINRLRGDNIRDYKCCILAVVSAFIGYACNCVLALYISFRQFGKLSLVLPRAKKLIGVIRLFLTSIGYRSTSLLSIGFIPNVICFIVVIGISIFLWKVLRSNTITNTDRFCIIYAELFIIAITIVGCIFLFTDMDMLSRYFLQIMIMAVVFIAYAHKHIFSGHKVSWLFLAIVMVLWVTNATMSYRTMAVRNTVSSYEPVVEYIRANQLEVGYSEFWDGNIITELTDGQVEMYTFSFIKTDIVSDIHDIYRWLQSSEHASVLPAGRVFVLVSKNDTTHITFFETLKRTTPQYETDEYLLYTFDSVGQLENAISQ